MVRPSRRKLSPQRQPEVTLLRPNQFFGRPSCRGHEEAREVILLTAHREIVSFWNVHQGADYRQDLDVR